MVATEEWKGEILADVASTSITRDELNETMTSLNTYMVDKVQDMLDKFLLGMSKTITTSEKISGCYSIGIGC